MLSSCMRLVLRTSLLRFYFDKLIDKDVDCDENASDLIS
jgi:hypothetical protein